MLFGAPLGRCCSGARAAPPNRRAAGSSPGVRAVYARRAGNLGMAGERARRRRRMGGGRAVGRAGGSRDAMQYEHTMPPPVDPPKRRSNSDVNCLGDAGLRSRNQSRREMEKRPPLAALAWAPAERTSAGTACRTECHGGESAAKCQQHRGAKRRRTARASWLRSHSKSLNDRSAPSMQLSSPLLRRPPNADKPVPLASLRVAEEEMLPYVRNTSFGRATITPHKPLR